MRFLIPNPGTNRSWTKAEWKAIDRYCRKVEKTLRPVLDERIVNAYHKLVVTGSVKL